jgi:hypothetical protein
LGAAQLSHKYLEDLEQDKGNQAALEGKKYTRILDKPYQ